MGKFPSVKDERAVTKSEMLAMPLAKEAELQVTEGCLVDSNGVPVALNCRFDRTKACGRIPYISAATLVRADPADLRKLFFTEIVDTLRFHGADA